MNEPTRHPLLHAGKWLLGDLLSTLTFAAVYAVTHSLAVSITMGIGLGVAQIIYLKLQHTAIDTMQWMSLGLVVVFGGASLLTRNPVFAMLKPTLIYVAVGLVMLQRGWMTRYLPPIAQARAGDVTTVFGYVWAAMMFLTAAANLVLALFAGVAAWSWFVAVFPIASKATLVGVQSVTTRMVVRRRLRGMATPAIA